MCFSSLRPCPRLREKWWPFSPITVRSAYSSAWYDSAFDVNNGVFRGHVQIYCCSEPMAGELCANCSNASGNAFVYTLPASVGSACNRYSSCYSSGVLRSGKAALCWRAVILPFASLPYLPSHSVCPSLRAPCLRWSLSAMCWRAHCACSYPAISAEQGS